MVNVRCITTTNTFTFDL